MSKRSLVDSLKSLAEKLGKHSDEACACDDDFFEEIVNEVPVQKEAGASAPKIFVESADKDDVVDELADALEKAVKKLKNEDSEEDKDGGDSDADMSKMTPREEGADGEANQGTEEDEDSDGISVLMPDSDEQVFHGSDDDVGGAGGVPFTCSALPVQIVATDCGGCMYNQAQEKGKVNCQFPQSANQAGFNPQDKYSEGQSAVGKKKVLVGKRSPIGEIAHDLDVCTSCGHTEPHIDGKPANETPCPECGGMMQSKTAKRSERKREITSNDFDLDKYLEDRKRLRIGLAKLAADPTMTDAEIKKERKRLTDEFKAKYPVEYPDIGTPQKKPKEDDSVVSIERKELVAEYPWLARALPMFRNSRKLLNALARIIVKFQVVISAEIDKVLSLDEIAKIIDDGKMLSIDGETVCYKMWRIVQNPNVPLGDFQTHFASQYAEAILEGAQDSADAAIAGWTGIMSLAQVIAKDKNKKMIIKRFLETDARPTELIKKLPAIIVLLEDLFQTGAVPEEGEEEFFEASEPISPPEITEEELEEALGRIRLQTKAGLWDSIKSIYSGWVSKMKQIGGRILKSQREMDMMKRDLDKFKATASRRTAAGELTFDVGGTLIAPDDGLPDKLRESGGVVEIDDDIGLFVVRDIPTAKGVHFVLKAIDGNVDEGTIWIEGNTKDEVPIGFYNEDVGFISIDEISDEFDNDLDNYLGLGGEYEGGSTIASRKTARKRLVAKDVNSNVIEAGDTVRVISRDSAVKSIDGKRVTGKVARVIRVDSGRKPYVEDGERKIGEFHALYVVGSNRDWHGKIYADEVEKVERKATGSVRRKPVRAKRRSISATPTITGPADQQGVDKMVEKKSEDIVNLIRERVNKKLQQEARKQSIRRRADAYTEHHDSETKRVDSDASKAQSERDSEYSRRKKEWSYTKWAREHDRRRKSAGDEVLKKQPDKGGKVPFETQKVNPIPQTNSVAPLDKWQKVKAARRKQMALEAKLERELRKALAEEFLKTPSAAPKSQPKETLKVNPIEQTNITDPITTPDKKWQKIKAAVMAEVKRELAGDDDKDDKKDDKDEKKDDKKDKKDKKDDKKDDKIDSDIEKAIEKYLDENLEKMIEKILNEDVEGEEEEGLEEKDFEFDVETGPAGEPMFFGEEDVFGMDEVAEEPIKASKEAEVSEEDDKEKVMAAISLVGLMDKVGAGSDSELGDVVQDIVGRYSLGEILAKTEALKGVVESREKEEDEPRVARKRPDKISIPGRANSGMATASRMEGSNIVDEGSGSMEDAENSLEFMFLGDEYLPQ